MKNLLKMILAFILGVFVGYWIKDHAILADSWPVEKLDQLSQQLNPASSSHNSYPSEQGALSANQLHGRTVILEDGSRASIPHLEDISLTLVEDLIIEKVNQVRSELGLQAVYKNDTLTQAARLRAEESSTSFSHTRPDGRGPFTVLSEEFYYPYYMVGENLGLATLINDEGYMASWLMQGWMDSPEHYETLVNPHFNEIGVGVTYADGNLYAAQLFGLLQ